MAWLADRENPKLSMRILRLKTTLFVPSPLFISRRDHHRIFKFVTTTVGTEQRSDTSVARMKIDPTSINGDNNN
jgi:hypothetical protein